MLEVSLDEDGRYHRQELISWWEQGRLAASRVLVVGAGALGNELLKCLALVGVGRITVIDLDLVESSNLARCVLFREADEGRPKAEVAARAARELNPDVRVEAIVGDVRADLGLGAFADHDVVLGGLDNREARVFINQACWKVGTPWIDGAIEGLLGIMRVFVPPDSACYECTLTEQDRRLLAVRRACTLLTREQMLSGKVPTTVTSASVIAALQVQEAIKLLHKETLPYGFAGKGVAFNGLTHDTYVVSYRRQDDCLAHESYEVEAWQSASEDEPLAEILDRGMREVGEDAVVELERELVRGLRCASCDEREPGIWPLVGLTERSARCPRCGGERSPELLHTIGPDDQLLTLRPRDLRLPADDVLTVRNGERRVQFRLAVRGSGDGRA